MCLRHSNVAEREHLSGKDLLTGFALAGEVITRVGESLDGASS
jgi:hypothetical protein